MKFKVILIAFIAIAIVTGASILFMIAFNSSTVAESQSSEEQASEKKTTETQPLSNASSYYSPTPVTATVSPDVSITYNGNAQSLRDASGNTVFPLMFNGSIYIPVRAVAEILGNDIKWSDETRTINISSTEQKTVTAPEPATITEPTGSTIPTQSAPSAQNEQTKNNLIGVDRAKLIALGNAGLAEQSVDFEECKLKQENGIQIYDVEFFCNGIEYEYKIDAINGSILKMEKKHRME